MNMKVLFFGLSVLLIALMFGCVQSPFCGNNTCEVGEGDSTSINYCARDCEVEKVPTAINAISDAVKSANPSGQVSAGPFVLPKSFEVSVVDLASKTDLDKESFVFTMGEFTDADKMETDGTYLIYRGDSQVINMSAIVVCKQNKDDLLDALERLDSSYDLSLAYDGCPNNEIGCCVIIPTKAVN